MAKFKVNFFFGHIDGGWSETYYNDAPDSGSSFTLANTLAGARAPLMGEGVTLQRIRVAQVGAARRSSITTVNLKVLNVGPCDQIYDAVLFSLYNTPDTVQRPLYMRGNPDKIYDESDATQFQAWLALAYSTFFSRLLNDPWYIQTKDTTNVFEAINAIGSADGGATTTVTLNGLFTGTRGQYVSFYGIKGLRRPMGTLLVNSVETVGGISTLSVSYQLPPNFLYQGNGRLRVYDPAFHKIDSRIFSKFTHRIVGRPFGVSRGRRRAIPK